MTKHLRVKFTVSATTLCAALALAVPATVSGAPAPIQTVPGMPPVVNPQNLYSEIGVNKFSPATAGVLSRIYVPNIKSSDVYVIDPATYKVVDHFDVGGNPQHGNFAARGPQQPGHQVHQRRLAGAVGANQTGDARRNRQADTIDPEYLAVKLRDIVEDDCLFR